MIAKRVADVCIAGVLLILLAPLLGLIGMAIRLDSPGPALFRHQRIGIEGRAFTLWKFRTLRLDAPIYGTKADTGYWATRIGRFLRQTALDEFPQLLNVLSGNMSLVGPRPEMPAVTERYTALERTRLTVKPGMTGPWQLAGDHERPIHEQLGFDLHYIQRRSLWYDAYLLCRTALFFVKSLFQPMNG